VESLVSLKVLLNPVLVEKVLNTLWEQNGERPTVFTIDLAWKLLSIGREIGLDQTELEQLDEFRASLETFRTTGLTTKNQKLIRQVLNPKVWASIVNLPEALMRQARQLEEHAPVKAAITAQIAVAIAILTAAPIRLGNLGRIRLGRT
jgi:hypothetical protein